MEKVLLKEVPDSVRIAKLAHDTETLRRLGRIGAAKKARLKRTRAAKEKAVAEAEVAEEAKQLTNIDEILAEDRARAEYADAFAHAMRNRIGWDDSLS